MKKLLFVLVACMMVFSCGSKNEGLEYAEQLKAALEAGDQELAQECLQKYYEWAYTADPKELVEVGQVWTDMLSEYSDELMGLDIDAALLPADGDLDAALNEAAEELDEALNDAAEQLEEAVGSAAEEAVTKALEGLF